MSATDGTQIKHRFHPSQQQQPTSSPRRRVGRYNPRVVLGVNAQNAILHMFDVLGRVTAESNVRSSEQGISVFRTKDPSRVCCLYRNGASFRESAWTTPREGASQVFGRQVPDGGSCRHAFLPIPWACAAPLMTRFVAVLLITVSVLSQSTKWSHRTNKTQISRIGWVAEWPKAVVLKTTVPRGTVGSNPTPSAQKALTAS